jgi:hypothetical protein
LLIEERFWLLAASFWQAQFAGSQEIGARSKASINTQKSTINNS